MKSSGQKGETSAEWISLIQDKTQPLCMESDIEGVSEQFQNEDEAVRTFSATAKLFWLYDN